MFGGGGGMCKSVSCSLLYSLSENSSFSVFFVGFFFPSLFFFFLMFSGLLSHTKSMCMW